MARWHQPENCAQMDLFATCQHRSGYENQESPWEDTHLIFFLNVFRGSNSLIQTNLAIKTGDFFDFSELLPKGLPHWVTPDVVQFGSHHHGLPGLSSDQTWLVTAGMHGISQTKSFDAPLKMTSNVSCGFKGFQCSCKTNDSLPQVALETSGKWINKYIYIYTCKQPGPTFAVSFASNTSKHELRNPH